MSTAQTNLSDFGATIDPQREPEFSIAADVGDWFDRYLDVADNMPCPFCGAGTARTQWPQHVNAAGCGPGADLL